MRRCVIKVTAYMIYMYMYWCMYIYVDVDVYGLKGENKTKPWRAAN